MKIVKVCGLRLILRYFVEQNILIILGVTLVHWMLPHLTPPIYMITGGIIAVVVAIGWAFMGRGYIL